MRTLKPFYKIVLILISALLIGTILHTLVNIADRIHETKVYKINYAAQADLKYKEYLSKLVDEVNLYISSKAPSSNLTGYYIVDKCQEYDIDIIFVLAQSQLEGNFATKGLASKTNSAWNVGAFDGKPFDKILGIYKYSHPDLSLEPYLKLLKSRYLVDKIEEDLMTKGQFVDISGRRYASDENYEVRLHDIYNSIKSNTGIDSLLNMSNYWKIRSNN